MGAVALVDDNVSYCVQVTVANPNPNPCPDPNVTLTLTTFSYCVQCAGSLEKVVLFGAYGWNAQP